MGEKFKQSALVKELVKLKNDLKPMTFREKCDHMWEYYKEWLVVVFLAVMAIGLTTTIISSRTKDVMVSGMMVNIKIEPVGMNYLTNDYEKYLGATSRRQVVELDYTSFGDVLDPTRGEDSYYASMILPARVTGAMLDYMILDQFAFEYYIAHEVYMDLGRVFSQEELAQFEAEGRLVYAMQENDTERWPVAIKITEIDFVKDNVNSGGDIYFALSGSSPRLDMCRNAWEYLHAWNKDGKEIQSNVVKEVLVSGMTVNVQLEQTGKSYMTSDYEKHLGATEQQVAELEHVSISAISEPTPDKVGDNSAMILHNRVADAKLDYIILDQFAFEYYITQEIYMDLEKVFSQEELAQLEAEDRLIYVAQENAAQRRPIAVKITELDFVKDNVTAEGDIYFALPGSSPRQDMCRNAWEYLNAWKKAE